MASAATLEPRRSPSTRVRRIAGGVLANAGSYVLTFGSQIVLVPFFLAYWGPEMYGQWLTVTAAVSYLSMLDLGMQTYVVNRLTEYHATAQFEEYTRALHGALALTLSVAGGAIALLAVIAYLTAGGHRATWSLVAFLVGSQAVLSIPFGLVSGVYRSAGEYPRGQMINNLRQFALIGLTAAVLALGWGPESVGALQLTLLLFTGGVIALDLRRRHPEIPLGFRHARWNDALAFVAPSSMFFATQLGMALLIQGSTLLVSHVFGPVAVVLFSTTRTLANFIRQVVATVHNAVWPEFTALHAQRRFDAMRRVHLLVAKSTVLLTVCGSVFLIFAGHTIANLWTRGKVAYDGGLMTAFLLLAACHAYSGTSGILLGACSRIKELLGCCLFASGVGLGIAYAMSVRFGLAGFVVGLFLAELPVTLFLPQVACRFIGESVRTFTAEVVVRGFGVLALVYTGVRLLLTVAPVGDGTIQRMLAVAVAAAALGLIGARAILLNKGEAARVQAACAGLLAR